MSCTACAAVAASPLSGACVTGCRACLVRRIARGPAHWDARRTGKLLPRYVAELAALGDVAAAHAEVKAASGFTRMRVNPNSIAVG